MKFWIQVKAPAGNWVDSVGTDDMESALRHAKYLRRARRGAETYEEARVIHRTDVQIWPKEKTKA